MMGHSLAISIKRRRSVGPQSGMTSHSWSGLDADGLTVALEAWPLPVALDVDIASSASGHSWAILIEADDLVSPRYCPFAKINVYDV
jgi:hypothetical protein